MDNGQERAIIARDTGPSRTGTMAVTVLTFLLLSLIQEPAINNGDWLRVTQFAGFAAPSWEPLADDYLLSQEPSIGHSTTMGLLAGALSWMTAVPLGGTFHSAFVAAGLALVFLAGLLRTASILEPRCARWILPALLATYAAYGFYFASFYEEAAVLAVLPWLCFGIERLNRQARYWPFTLAGAAILYAKVQMAFAFPLIALPLLVGLSRPAERARAAGACAVLFAVTALALNSVHTQTADPNAYNRYYNGIGWTLLDVEDWPARTFADRHARFYAQQVSLQNASPALPTFPELTGTSFWPTGDALPRATADEQERRANILAQGRLPDYAAFLGAHPWIAADLAVTTYAVTARSDYRLAYIRATPPLQNDVLALIRQGRDVVLDHLAPLVGLVLAVLLLRHPAPRAVLAVWWLALAPLFVVAGDGFYEFEKHMVPFAILVPYIIAIIRSAHPRSGRGGPLPRSAGPGG